MRAGGPWPEAAHEQIAVRAPAPVKQALLAGRADIDHGLPGQRWWRWQRHLVAATEGSKATGERAVCRAPGDDRGATDRTGPFRAAMAIWSVSVAVSQGVVEVHAGRPALALDLRSDSTRASDFLNR